MLTASASIIADSILAQMPFPELTACMGQPMYQEMTVIHCKMFQNLKAITSSHNGRQAEYLWILMDPTIYATDYGGMFVPPVDPGDYPRLPAAATSHQKDKALACHKQELLEYHEYGAIMVFCCNQLQKAIHEDYLAKLEDACLGLGKKMPKEILDHVIAHYAKITIPM